MKRSTKITLALSAAAGLGLVVAAAIAHPVGVGPEMMMHGEDGGRMGGPMTGAMHDDASFADDMRLVHAMLVDNTKIKRTVENLPDGIRTVTQSDDPAVARAINAHVASMGKRLNEGRVFNLFSQTLPELFENKGEIKTIVQATDKGSTVTQTSEDPKVVAALQAHAHEVSELAREGMVAMMRNMRARMMSSAAQP